MYNNSVRLILRLVVVIKLYDFTPCKFFIAALTDGFQLDSKRQQISSGHQDSSVSLSWF